MNRRPVRPENICFYSNSCKFCEAFFLELKKTPYKNEFQFVCVDPSPQRPQLPSWLQKVPTLFIDGKALTDNEVYNWIFERKLKDGIQGETVANEPAGILPGEMFGGITSDTYSYMDGSETLMNFEARGDSVHQQQAAASQFPLGGRTEQQKSRKEKQFDDDMQRYQREREIGMPQMPRRM